jgi:hypothetical protein
LSRCCWLRSVQPNWINWNYWIRFPLPLPNGERSISTPPSAISWASSRGDQGHAHDGADLVLSTPLVPNRPSCEPSRAFAGSLAPNGQGRGRWDRGAGTSVQKQKTRNNPPKVVFITHHAYYPCRTAARSPCHRRTVRSGLGVPSWTETAAMLHDSQGLRSTQ